MELYVLRHGVAEPRESGKYPEDRNRPLTPAGMKKMKEIAAGMKNMGVEFDLILSSPYLRARQTAEIVAKEYKEPRKLKISDNLEPGRSFGEIAAELQENFTTNRSMIIVGHEPFLSAVISALLSGADTIAMNLKKGGLCKLRMESMSHPMRATLEWLLTPKQLRAVR
jgi:phosphohistidine phosphatase